MYYQVNINSTAYLIGSEESSNIEFIENTVIDPTRSYDKQFVCKDPKVIDLMNRTIKAGRLDGRLEIRAFLQAKQEKQIPITYGLTINTSQGDFYFNTNFVIDQYKHNLLTNLFLGSEESRFINTVTANKRGNPYSTPLTSILGALPASFTVKSITINIATYVDVKTDVQILGIKFSPNQFRLGLQVHGITRRVISTKKGVKVSFDSIKKLAHPNIKKYFLALKNKRVIDKKDSIQVVNTYLNNSNNIEKADFEHLLKFYSDELLNNSFVQVYNLEKNSKYFAQALIIHSFVSAKESTKELSKYSIKMPDKITFKEKGYGKAFKDIYAYFFDFEILYKNSSIFDQSRLEKLLQNIEYCKMKYHARLIESEQILEFNCKLTPTRTTSAWFRAKLEEPENVDEVKSLLKRADSGKVQLILKIANNEEISVSYNVGNYDNS